MLDHPENCYTRTGAGVAVIAIVCIGFLIFLVVLGVARIRSAQRRSVEVSMDDRQEMEWDNSALNITVNPMDREVSRRLKHMLVACLSKPTQLEARSSSRLPM